MVLEVAVAVLLLRQVEQQLLVKVLLAVLRLAVMQEVEVAALVLLAVRPQLQELVLLEQGLVQQ